MTGHGPAEPRPDPPAADRPTSPWAPAIGRARPAPPAEPAEPPAPGQSGPPAPPSGQPVAQPGQPVPGPARPAPAQPDADAPGSAMPPPAAVRAAVQVPTSPAPPAGPPAQAAPPTAAVPPTPTQAAPPPPAQGAPPPSATPAAGRFPAAAPVLGAPTTPAAAPPPAAPGPAATQAAAPVTARQVAPGAVLAAGTAAAAPAPVAAPMPQRLPDGAGDGPAPDSPPREDGGGARRRHVGRARLVPLRIGSHLASRAALRHLLPTGHATGLIVGTDRFQRPVPVRFFRPEPTRIGLVGDVGTGQLLAFRALALGAHVVVVTAVPDLWHHFGQRAAERGDRLAVLPGEGPLRLAGYAQRPSLVVYDLGLAGPTSPPPLGRWQTQLTVLRRLDRSGVPVLQECHLVMLQRLADPEAALAATALRLTGQNSQMLQVMADDMLALLGGGTDRYVWLAPTTVEQGCVDASPR